MTPERKIDSRVAAIQLARIEQAEQSGLLSARDAKEARARAGQVMVLTVDGRSLVYVFAVDGAPAWTHVITIGAMPSDMAAALDVDDFMRLAVHDHYTVRYDELDRVIVVPCQQLVRDEQDGSRS